MSDMRKTAGALLRQLDAARPRRAIDLAQTRQLLNAVVAPYNAEELVSELVRAAWEWGVSCEIDDVRWGESGDSHNQYLAGRVAELQSKLHSLILATPAA